MTKLTLTDDWLRPAKAADTCEQRRLVQTWCDEIEHTVSCGDIGSLHVLMETHSEFIRLVQPEVTLESLAPFVRQKGFFVELFGFSTSSTTATRSTFWFGSDAQRRAALLTLAHMKIHSVIALLEAQPSCQNRFWDIVKKDPTNTELHDSAKWLSLLTGMAPISLRPYACDTHQMYYWVGRSLRGTIDWSEENIAQLQASIIQLTAEPRTFVIEKLAVAIGYAIKNKWQMVVIGKLCGIDNPTPFDAMSLLMPKSGFNWKAAESIDIEFDDAVTQAKCASSNDVAVVLPPTLLV